MAHQVWVRPFQAETDAKLLVEWLYAGREKNRFDPEIFRKKQVEIWTAFDDTGIVGFIPVARCYLVESLAFKPGIDPRVEAQALQSWQRVQVNEAFKNNVADAFFVTFDETVLEFAKRYGWKDVVVPMVNMHFAGLEGKPVLKEGD